MSEELKACPFCGGKLNKADADTMYPTGTMWADHEDGSRYYFSEGLYRGIESQMPNPEGRCVLVQCAENYGGCGAEIHGDSEQEAIEKWNRRAGDV